MKYIKLLTFLLLFQLSACANNASNVNNSSTPLTGNFVIERNPQNNTISYIKDDNPSLTLTSSANGQSLQDVGLSFLQTHRKDFLLANPYDELTVDSVKKDDLGYTRIKLNQKYQGIPVWNGIISLQFDRQNLLQLVKGQYFPTPSSININSGLSQSELFRKLNGINPAISEAKYSSQKIVFHQNNAPRLAYLLKPSRQTNLTGNELIVDAITASSLNSMSSIQTLR